MEKEEISGNSGKRSGAGKRKPYKSKYRYKVLNLIIQGYSNSQIAHQFECTRTYVTMLRKEWNEMPEEKKKATIKRIHEEFYGEKQEELKQQPGFRTPYTAAKGRFIRSGY